MLSVADARSQILARIDSLGSETVAIGAAGGRVLAGDALATRALPPWDNSAMDGFAVRSADVPGRLPIAGESAAGSEPGLDHRPGTATRIMTGAPMPRGADCVVIREEVTLEGDLAIIEVGAAPGANVRRAGEDIAPGALAVAAGAELGPGEIGLLAALGFPEVVVGRRPRVAILSTGDELVDVTAEPPPSKIINSNAYALAAQIASCGGEPQRLAAVEDDRERVTRAVVAALADADVLITSGGVSVGDYDFVKEAFGAADIDIEFWKVAVRPGKPLAFGIAPGGQPVFGLPGNPVSSMVSFELFVRPALLAMQGASAVDRPRATVTLSGGYRKSAGRAHYLRAAVRRDGAALIATPMARQGSGMLTSMVGVDALVAIPAETTEVDDGALLEALLLRAV
jgi:molybdopterin molybdotransferase